MNNSGRHFVNNNTDTEKKIVDIVDYINGVEILFLLFSLRFDVYFLLDFCLEYIPSFHTPGFEVFVRCFFFYR